MPHLLHPLLLREVTLSREPVAIPDILIGRCVIHFREEVEEALKNQKKVKRTLAQGRSSKLPGIMRTYLQYYGKAPKTEEEKKRMQILETLVRKAAERLPEKERQDIDLSVLAAPFHSRNAAKVLKIFSLFETQLEEEFRRATGRKITKKEKPPENAPAGKPVNEARRAFFDSLIGGTVVATAFSLEPRPWIMEMIQKVRRALESTAQADGGVDFREIPASSTALETVLESSVPEYVTETRTYRDNILNPYAVAQYFLGNRFRYNGQEDVTYRGRNQRAHRFTQIGEKSGYLGRGKESKNLWKTTTLATTINTLLQVTRLSNPQISHWIAWSYQRAFSVKLDINYLTIVREPNGKVAEVLYNAPVGFERVLEINVAKERNDDAPSQPGGHISRNLEVQNILSENGRLLLPSGLSPLHDIVVPVELMPRDPEFNLDIMGRISWNALRASDLAERIEKLKAIENIERLKPPESASLFGRTQLHRPMAPYVGKNDLLLKKMADHLLKNTARDMHGQRMLKLAEFVQELPYKEEFDTDRNRNGLLTLFNGGGDCNNLSVLFAELMLASGYRTAIFTIGPRVKNGSLHATGAVPAEFFGSGYQKWHTGRWPQREWIAMELTAKLPPGEPLLGEDKNSTVFSIEVL